VSREDIAAATALLENATGALSASAARSSRSQCSSRPLGRLAASRTKISVWVPRRKADAARKRLRAELGLAQRRGILGDLKLEEERVCDAAWASAWKQFYKPFEIAPSIFVAPSWERAFRAARGAVTLWLDPGMAFGTGQHPSTQLALALMLRFLRRGSTMLDIGCGSGILALAAAVRGASAYASDSDPIAVRMTRANFASNGLRAQAVVRAHDVPATFPPADLIVANITARVLERLGAQLATKLKPRGILITSGIVESGKRRVLRAADRTGLQHIATSADGEWFAFAHQKRRR
jgi:ribosomal protein L11 methyltransferase